MNKEQKLSALALLAVKNRETKAICDREFLEEVRLLTAWLDDPTVPLAAEAWQQQKEKAKKALEEFNKASDNYLRAADEVNA